MDDDDPRKKALDYKRPEMPWEREGMAGPDRLGWMSAGFEFLAAVALCGGVGYWLDQSQGWHPWGLVVGAMIGVAAGMYRLISRALISGKKAEAEDQRGPRT